MTSEHTPQDFTTPVYVNENDFFRIRLPWSEVCMSLRVHDREMTAQLLPSAMPMVQLYDAEGHRFSSPITAPEAGLFTDCIDGRQYGYGITDIADSPHGLEYTGCHTCPCCGDVTYGSTLLCSDCTSAGCERTTDAGGDTGYSNCQQTPVYFRDEWSECELYRVTGHHTFITFQFTGISQCAECGIPEVQ